MALTEREAIALVRKRPDVMQYCEENFFKITCPDVCPYYALCRSWDYENQYGPGTMYPGFIPGFMKRDRERNNE